jgi:cell volume regulation protein A
MPPPSAPDPRLLGDFFVSGEVTLGALAEIYGLTVAEHHAATTLADHFAEELKRAPRQNDIVPLGPIALLAQRVVNGRVATVGLKLAEDEAAPAGLSRARQIARRIWAKLR